MKSFAQFLVEEQCAIYSSEQLNNLEKFADKRAMYNYELKDKLGDFYNVLSWEYPTETAVKCATFFEF